MKLSQRKREALYHVIHEGFVNLRLKLFHRRIPDDDVDAVIAQAGEQIARAAISAVETVRGEK